ncbi:MAG: alpha-amylase domain-containing protein [Bacteroidia bacterium]|nr:alpha-amylase domain-containing protein [Bacteroidia bacterium]
MRNLKRFMRGALAALLLLLVLVPAAQAQTRVKKVVLQGFWWDYRNNNFPGGWANYLTELAPRLKALGVDAVWIPPSYKNEDSTWVGYSPFDHYDLGDKYQKGNLRTALGTKDELLRMIAVMHANGIEVIQDVVLNHVDRAGSENGSGGYDPDSYSTQTNGGYKTFRYASWATPVTDESQSDYWNRSGRWHKNFPNFYPNLLNGCCTNDINSSFWGPDISYESSAYGQASNITGGFNPPQAANYMRDQSRNWLMWYKKQTGVDGFRWDAVKHFPTYVQQDLSFNVKYTVPAWAQGGNAMFNVGEYVGGKSSLDGYVNNVATQNGNVEKLMGTFDFGLRSYDAAGGLYGMIYGFGGFNMASLPAAQQNERYYDYNGGTLRVHRTVPFVNNHDTYRPVLDANGNITGWNTGSELAPHIDPTEPRLSAAYAVMMTMDGNPQIFFEDLFDLTQSNRFTHQPSNAAQLPVRSDLLNLIWCHQNLDFKGGDYIVPHQSGDYLILGRAGRVLVGVTDSWDTWQNQWVPTSFPPGTVLKDYSGANGTATVTVNGSGWAPINTPPVNPALNIAGRRGYSVWAPVGQDGDTYTGPANPVTTQEWEMADDLGDSHCKSLGQGGRLPDNSCNRRVAGKIFARGGTPLTYRVYPSNPARSLTLELWDLQGNLLDQIAGTGELADTYTPAADGWVVIKLRNTGSSYPGQTAFVQAAYQAPLTVDVESYVNENQIAIWTGNGGNADWSNCRNWEGGVTPDAATDVLIPSCALPGPLVSGQVAARQLTIEPGADLALDPTATLAVFGNWDNHGTFTANGGRVRFEGAARQTITGATGFGILELDNAEGLELLADVSVSQELLLTDGSIELGIFDLDLGSAALNGISAARYILTDNTPAGAGSLIRQVPGNGSTVLFPIGTSGSYTPASLSNTGDAASFRARVFNGVYEEGTQGASVSDPGCIVARSWDIAPVGLPAAVNATLSLSWNTGEEGADFQRTASFLSRNPGGPGQVWTALAPPQSALGSGPYSQRASGITQFSVFKCVSCAGETFPVEWLSFTGENQQGKALLHWSTAQESGNAGFFVEKSADGIAFREIGFVPAGGGSGVQTYAFEDAALLADSYYRLRQTDVDGGMSLSAAVRVAFDPGMRRIQLYPVPASGRISLESSGFQDGANLTLQIASLSGQTVFRASGTLRTLQEELNRWAASAAAGEYLARMSAEGQVFVQRIVME